MESSLLTFEIFLDRFLNLYQQGDYAQALQLMEISGPCFPENAFQILAWQSAMLARLGRVKEGIQVFESAYEAGYWYHEGALLHDPDFAALKDHPTFPGLVERFAARRKAAIPRLLPDRQIVEPATPGSHPLCLVLHGNYSNPAMTIPYWRSLVEQGWRLAVLQSSQPGWASSNYVWDDVPKALAEVKHHFSDLLARLPAAPDSIIAGGFSMGAAIAVRMALDPDFHLRGVIAHEAWFTDEALADLEKTLASAPPTRTRVALIAGKENVEYADIAQKVYDLLACSGIPCRVMDSSNPRHGYPPDFAAVLRQAMEWIDQ